MGFLSSLGKLFHREHIPTPEERAELEAVKKQIRDRCKRFRSLLSANKTALEIMSDIEEHLSGTRPFGMEYIRGAGTRAAASVYQMVRELNSLTGNAYPELPDAFSRVSGHIDTVLKPAVYPPDGPLVLPLQAISLANIQEVGGKMANLGEVSSGAGLPVPSGFAVTVTAYRLFLKENGLAEEIEKRIPGFPIVLHGSSSVPQDKVAIINKYGGALKDAIGIPEDQLREAAKSAVCKINIDSDGRLAMTAAVREIFATKPAEFDPRKYLGPARDSLRELYKHKLTDVLGSANTVK